MTLISTIYRRQTRMWMSMTRIIILVTSICV